MLFKKCGWNAEAGCFAKGVPDFYELYADIGHCMGNRHVVHDEDIASPTCAVVNVALDLNGQPPCRSSNAC